MSGSKRKSNDVSDTEYADFDIFNDLNFNRLEWSKRKFTLKEFADMFKTPQMILICKGQYRLLGCPSEFGLDSWIFAWCKNSRFKVEAQCLHSETREAGHLFEIEDNYDDGLFEILSGERDGLLQIKRVSELASYPNKSFMLMESIPVYASYLKGKWNKGYSKEKRCIRNKGYKIIVDKVITADFGSKSGSMLRCSSFSGETVFLSMEETGNFALIGDPKGLQTISSLKASNQFPIDVKLVDGRPPPGAKYKKRFSPLMRFHRGRIEDVLTVWTMDKGTTLIHIPIECPMEVRILENLNVVLELPIHKEIVRRIHEISKLKFEDPYQLQATSQMRPPTTSSTIVSPSISTTPTSIPSQSTSDALKPSDAHFPRPSNSNHPTTISSTEIHLSTTSDNGPVDVTDIHQPSTSGLSTTTTDIHRPSTSGLLNITHHGDRPSFLSTPSIPTAKVFRPWS